MNDDREALVASGTMSVPDAEAFSGLGRSYLYELMSRGELRFLKVGKRRLIPRTELTRFLATSLVGANQ